MLKEIHEVLRPKDKLVFKISDRLYQQVLVPTAKFLKLLAEKEGFKKCFAVTDKILSHSMSTQSAIRDGMVERMIHLE